MGYRIIRQARYGEHINLTCKNHPHLRWNTKNINNIGARTIFFDWHSGEVECNCTIRDLIVLPEYAEMPELPE